jgi:hypothetical protein
VATASKNEPIIEFPFQIVIGNRSIHLRYDQLAATFPPHPTKPMTDMYADACNFESEKNPPPSPVIKDFGLSGSEIEDAFADELIRRITLGAAYYKTLNAPFHPDVKLHEEKNLNTAAIDSCRSLLKRADFPRVFAAFDAADGVYGGGSTVTPSTGGADHI